LEWLVSQSLSRSKLQVICCGEEVPGTCNKNNKKVSQRKGKKKVGRMRVVQENSWQDESGPRFPRRGISLVIAG
jgi:hypothetical protein